MYLNANFLYTIHEDFGPLSANRNKHHGIVKNGDCSFLRTVDLANIAKKKIDSLYVLFLGATIEDAKKLLKIYFSSINEPVPMRFTACTPIMDNNSKKSHFYNGSDTKHLANSCYKFLNAFYIFLSHHWNP